MRDPVVRQYDRLATRYDSRWADYINVTTVETARRIAVEPGYRVLDVACGTGSLLAALKDKHGGAHLTGIDLSDKMLLVARRKLPDDVRLVLGDASALPFVDEYFDVVASASAFHFMRKPTRVLEELGRVLKPNGQLVITDWCDDFLACKICDLFLRIFDRAHYRTYTSGECLKLVRGADFTNASVEKYRVSWLWGLMTARGEKAAG